MQYFATYAGFVFISTWVYQFLKFTLIRELLGINEVENIPFNGIFWGYTVLTDEQLLLRVIALSALLVLSVIGSRSLNIVESYHNDTLLNKAEVRALDDDELYLKVLKQKEFMFWTNMTLFWPIINFIASFFHIALMLLITYEALYWRLSWVMVVYLFFSIGPWYNLNVDALGTKNLGKDKPLDYYANAEVQKQRYKKWRVLMFITMIAWIVIFPSNTFLEIMNKGIESKLIFYGVWAGLLYPKTTPNVTFFGHVSGYLMILFFLIIEKKCLDWLADGDTRQGQIDYEQTIGGQQHQQNYDMLAKEIERRQKIEDRRLSKNKSPLKKIGFAGLDEEGKIDPKEKLKQELDSAYNIMRRDDKKEETKKPHKPALKSAMKRTKQHDIGPTGPRPFEETMRSKTDIDVQGSNESDVEFNILFTRDDPKRNDTKKLLLFQYKIKFMRGAKRLVEEIITFSMLICALYKDNILALIYYWISIRMLIENVSLAYRMKAAFYVSVFALFQYFLCLSNWNKYNSPLELPIPFNIDYESYYVNPPLPLPWVDKISISSQWKKYL